MIKFHDILIKSHQISPYFVAESRRGLLGGFQNLLEVTRKCSICKNNDDDDDDQVDDDDDDDDDDNDDDYADDDDEDDDNDDAVLTRIGCVWSAWVAICWIARTAED